MNKAEERALELYPIENGEVFDANGDIYESDDKNYAERFAYIKGYHQAERDLELTWEDIKEICVQSVLVEVDLGGLVSDERHYTEVLKRFKDYKERKEK